MTLTDSIINPIKFCRPIEQLIQDAIANGTFANLQTHLPDDLASSEDDWREIISDHVAVDIPANGLTIITDGMAVFFSHQMVKECKQLLTPLVNSFCKKRAKDFQTDAIVTPELLPLSDVATAVGERYSELLDLQSAHDHEQKHDAERSLLWTVEDDRTNNDGPLVKFCRRALFSNDLQRRCTRALALEVDQLKSAQRGASTSARLEGAAKIHTMRESFESSFRTLCHLLQIFSKSLDVLGGRAQQSNENGNTSLVVDEMKNELLVGCGSCLARLVTEHCFFEHEIETGLVFESCGNKSEESCHVATLSFPCIALKGGFRRLRSAVPGSTGINLEQMWNLCSDSDDHTNDVGAGQKLDAFISHLKESCLTLVGIPFSVLDKKSERKVLAARRQGLLERLEVAQEKEEVRMCSVVLIYYQVKNLSIAGVDTINLVMTRFFEQDKKIPLKVTKALQILKSEDGIEISEVLIAGVKKFGLAKNSKALAAAAEDDV